MKWSNHAESRGPDKCGPADVAVGYLQQAARIVAGEQKLGDTPEERTANLRKAHNVLLAAGQGQRKLERDTRVWFGGMWVGRQR